MERGAFESPLPLAGEGQGEGFWLLHERARAHHWEGAGQLSIKVLLRGRARYRTDGGLFLVDERSYLVLNAGQRYEVLIDEQHEAESWCLFLDEALAAQVHAGLMLPGAALLDGATAAPPTFITRTTPHDELLTPALRRLAAALRSGPEPLERDELLTLVLARLIGLHSAQQREIAAVDAGRPATRAELYRRLHRARDYLRASYDQQVTLDELAAVAALSPTHLLRSFKALFGHTPHQELTAARLDHARSLLAASTLSITEICMDVGFSSLGSFSTLFRRHVGLSPQQYRAAQR